MKTTKHLALALILLLATSSMLWVESVSAQSIPKPSVPEFSLKYVDHSYDVPTTYGTDPYTGKTIITQEGYHVQIILLKSPLKIKRSLLTAMKMAP
jgi:hypothetical protein